MHTRCGSCPVPSLCYTGLSFLLSVLSTSRAGTQDGWQEAQSCALNHWAFVLRRRKRPSQLPGARKDAGISCLPRVSPSTSPHPQHPRFWPLSVFLGQDGSPHSISLASIYLYTSWHSWRDHQSWLFFCFRGNRWFPLLDCEHSICFFIVSSAHKEWAVFLGAALCELSPPTAERLPCCDASLCQHLLPQWLRVGNRTSNWSPTSKCWHMLTLHSPIVEDGIEQWEWSVQLWAVFWGQGSVS